MPFALFHPSRALTQISWALPSNKCTLSIIKTAKKLHVRSLCKYCVFKDLSDIMRKNAFCVLYIHFYWQLFFIFMVPFEDYLSSRGSKNRENCRFYG